MGYGALLSRISTEQKWAPFHVDGMIRPSYDGRYLAAWGLFGVALGSLLPWFDGKWEKIFGEGADEEEPVFDGNDDPGTDWALVIRGIGAFAGIVFAIVSVTLLIMHDKVAETNSCTEESAMGVYDAGFHDACSSEPFPVVSY